MNIKINKEECIGCGACVATCPELFEINDQNKAEAKTEKVPENLESKAKEAAESCPVNVINIE